MTEKLVRDRIPEIIRQEGLDPATRVADPDEYAAALRGKLQEEVDEFLESGSMVELADILEVVQALAENQGIKWRQLLRAKEVKRRKRGGFSQRIILDQS